MSNKNHAFCRLLLAEASNDYSLNSRDFTVTKSTIGSFEVEGPDKFYCNAPQACCKYAAKHDAMESYHTRHHGPREPRERS